MVWKKLLESGKVQKKSISAEEVKIVLGKAQRTLRSAALLLEEDEESAYQLAYEAMLIGGRALMFSYGVKPRSVGAHKITVEFCELSLGKEYQLFIGKLDRARKKRHYLMYGIGQIISSTEAANLIQTAEKFLSIIEKEVKWH
ncbi:MAG: HEPN domain-containing protein [Candidatus Omnitrophica bacterium]|nr:HEPN domain-containing protein [Candidatus Omnitrophota bacterium]